MESYGYNWEETVLGIEEGNPYFDLTLTKGKGTVVVSSAMAFYVFMDLESVRDLFGESDDFYNVLFSDEALDIPAGRLYVALVVLIFVCYFAINRVLVGRLKKMIPAEVLKNRE